MIKTNYHTHTKFSDGIATPEIIIEKAIEKGFTILGISDHSPVPFFSAWNMKFENLLLYKNKINDLKIKYSDKINIFLGIEADYIDNFLSFEFLKQYTFDYVIGGIHYLNKKFDENTYFTIDYSPEIFEKAIIELFENNVQKLIKEYYNNLNSMVNNQKPDIIAHFDIVEKFNKNNRFFNSEEVWYTKVVDDSIEIIKNSNSLVEINSRSKYRGLINDFNPSLKIIKKMNNYNIPFVISGDIHNPIEFDFYWSDTINLIKQIGVKKIFFLDNSGWKTQYL